MTKRSCKLFMPSSLLLLVILAGCGQIAGGSSGGSSAASTTINTLTPTVTRTATTAPPTAYDCEAKVPITIAEVERVTQMTLSPSSTYSYGEKPYDCLLIARYGVGVDITYVPKGDDKNTAAYYKQVVDHWDYDMAHTRQRGFVTVIGVDSILLANNSVILKTASAICIIGIQSGDNSNAGHEREAEQEIELAKIIGPRMA